MRTNSRKPTPLRYRADGYYASDYYKVEEIEAADGLALNWGKVENLVSAMAAFNPPPVGETVLTGAMADALNPVIAANWSSAA